MALSAVMILLPVLCAVVILTMAAIVYHHMRS